MAEDFTKASLKYLVSAQFIDLKGEIQIQTK